MTIDSGMVEAWHNQGPDARHPDDGELINPKPTLNDAIKEPPVPLRESIDSSKTAEVSSEAYDAMDQVRSKLVREDQIAQIKKESGLSGSENLQNQSSQAQTLRSFISRFTRKLPH